MNTSYKRYAAGLAVATTITALTLATPAFAQTNGNHYGWMRPNNPHNPGMMGTSTRPMNGMMGMMNGQKPAVFGTVTAINGTNITVASHSFGNSPSHLAATTTYTVDASNATVYKNNATSTLSSVAVNDHIIVMGTVSGTNVTATSIRDGIPMMMRGRGPNGSDNDSGTGQSLPFSGNGEPVVAGTVSSVNGNSFSITTGSNTSYTIDATNATVKKASATSTVSAVASGDYVIVQGQVNGSSVTASTVLDNGQRPAPGSSQANTPKPGNGGGFMGAIGNFFKRIFGF